MMKIKIFLGVLMVVTFWITAVSGVSAQLNCQAHSCDASQMCFYGTASCAGYCESAPFLSCESGVCNAVQNEICVLGPIPEDNILIVDFGSSSATNIFGLAGWNTAIKDQYTNYVNIGPGGTTIVTGSNRSYNYQGVTGSSRSFVDGDKISVTWYNNSGVTINFTPRISFNDPDRPSGGVVGDWYDMTPVLVTANGTNVSEYTINSGTAGNYSLVNVNVNYSNNQIVIADKIVLTPAVPEPALTGSPDSVNRGQNVTVSWSDLIEPTEHIWFALYENSGVADDNFLDWRWASNCSKTSTEVSAPVDGSCQFDMDFPIGNTYEFRIFSNNDTNDKIATSNPVTVTDFVFNVTAQDNPMIVTKSNTSSVSAQNVIYKLLISGSPQAVTLSIGELPEGVSLLGISNQSCLVGNENCYSSILTLSIAPSAVPGYYSIPVVGTATTHSVETEFNLMIEPELASGFQVSCISSVDHVILGQTTSWTANIENGTPPYSYQWQFSNHSPSDPPAIVSSSTINTYSTLFTTIGYKTISVTVTDANSESVGPIICSTPSGAPSVPLRVWFFPAFSEI